MFNVFRLNACYWFWNRCQWICRFIDFYKRQLRRIWHEELKLHKLGVCNSLATTTEVNVVGQNIAKKLPLWFHAVRHFHTLQPARITKELSQRLSTQTEYELYKCRIYCRSSLLRIIVAEGICVYHSHVQNCFTL